MDCTCCISGSLRRMVCSVVSDSLQPHGPQPTRLLCPWDFPSKNTGVGRHVLPQGIFPIQGSNSHLLHHRWILYLLSHWRCSRMMVTGTNYSISCFYNLVPRPIYFVYLKQKQKQKTWWVATHAWYLEAKKDRGQLFLFSCLLLVRFPHKMSFLVLLRFITKPC